MKNIIILALLGFLLSSCTTMQPFTKNDITTEGIRYKYGSSDGVKAGDKIVAYKAHNPGARNSSYRHAGELTVIRVENDHAIMKKDYEFPVDETVSFKAE